MGPLDLLFGQIKNQIEQHASPNTPGPSYDPGSLLGPLAGLFGQHAQQSGADFDQSAYNQGGNSGGYGNDVRPASEDPYGDPADQPGAQEGFGDVRPASEDPFGDPADQR